MSETDLTSERREESFVFVVFCLRIWSGIYNAPGGVKMSETDRTVATVQSELLQRFVSDRNRPTVRGGFLSAVAQFRFGSGWRSGYALRNPYS